MLWYDLCKVGITEKIHERASLIRDVVSSGNDGVVTTFAVVAGSLGASLSPSVILILGFANLFADGLSMATGSYLGVKSEIEFEKKSGEKIKMGNKPLENGITTFFSFVIAGLVPLLPYLFKFNNAFKTSSFFVFITLLTIGIFRGMITKKSVVRTSIENIIIGGISAVVAYFVGSLVEKYLI